MAWLPDRKKVYDIHFMLVEMFLNTSDPIDPPGVKSENALESACFRPYTSLDGIEKYPTVEQKCAALFHSLIKNHAFHNGNKRTAFATLVATLYANRRKFKNQINDYDIRNTIVKIASNNLTSNDADSDFVVEVISTWIRRNIVKLNQKMPEIKTNEFIDSCVAAGVEHKVSNGSHILNNNSGLLSSIFRPRSVKFSLSTSKLPGNVCKEYRRTLGLSDYDIPEDGSGREEIERFRRIYVLLANA
ncbi:MAG: type II toxin-antitoxin system death-on-curing family toxin [Pleurocapsa minor GSE-CHR-MK-17-07R]|jgi:death-on-curing family protein|nr:type II toxin-antitoxin system death-on-curing family toxin [Pleurocapsa minor GSE-CHR-MK 17-07R]